MQNDKNNKNIIEETLSGKTQLQGWILIASAIILFLHTMGYFVFVNFIIIAIAIYLFLKGAVKVNLLDKLKNLYEWIKEKISRK